ncbi:hypothetical protein, partial [Caldalkalibacillus thermarum]|uniref:hypothetical protein n=1 Tax=Caldalkalibacillus thermarum TaxID=296745 RepID=UPI00166B60CE
QFVPDQPAAQKQQKLAPVIAAGIQKTIDRIFSGKIQCVFLLKGLLQIFLAKHQEKKEFEKRQASPSAIFHKIGLFE